MSDENDSVETVDENDDFISFEEVSLEENESEKDNSDKVTDKETEVKEDDKSEESETKEDTGKGDDKESKETEVKETSSEKKEIKLVSFSKGDDKFELPVDAVIKHKVDGKEVEFTVQALLNDKAGQEHWDKKNSELSAREKEVNFDKSMYMKEKEAFVGKMNHFVDSVNKQDAAGAINALARITGENALDLRTHFVTLMETQAKNYWKLSDEDRKKVDTDLEIKYYKDRDKQRDDQATVDQEFEAAEKKFTAFQIENKLDDGSMVALADQVTGKSIELSIEALETQHKSNVVQGKASEMLGKIDPSLKDDEDYVTQVADFIIKNPDLSDLQLGLSIKEAVESLNSSDTKTKTGKKANSSDELKDRINKNNSTPSAKDTNLSEDLDDVADFDEISYE